MIRRFKQLFSNQYPNPSFDIEYWRVRILNAVLLASAVAGGVAYLLNLQVALQRGDFLILAAYTTIYVWTVAITLVRRIPYILRAGTLIFILYTAGLFSALQYASAGDARVWWLGATILTTVFFSARVGILIAVFSTLNYLGIGLLMNQLIIPAPLLDEYLDPTSSFPWVSTGVTYFVISLLGVISFGVLIRGLRTNLERATQLAKELEADRQQLQAHTAVVERREVQIHTAAEIVRAISAELDTDKLLTTVVNLVKERFNLYYVGVFLLDESRQFAVLRVGTGEAGKRMVADGHKLPIGGTSMIGWAISNKQARIALDVGEDAVRFQNPYLPSTRSELALPMVSSEERVLGALTVQSALPRAFDEDDVTVLQGIADSLAIALDHATLFNQLQESLQEIESLHRQYLSQAWSDVVAQEGQLSFTFENPQAVAPTNGNGKKLEIPLVLRGQTIGSITVEGDPATLTEEDKAFLERVAAQAALALENARLVQQNERTALLNRTITNITSKVWAATSVDGVLRTALRELGQTLDASDAVIQLHLPDQSGSG